MSGVHRLARGDAHAAERREEIGLRRPLAPRTIAKHLAPVKAMFADAVEDDQLAVNPAKVRVNVEAPGGAGGRPRCVRSPTSSSPLCSRPR